jgi:hypothetical protein
MSDTPRVDAMESAFQESGMYGTFAPVALCRQFEREITILRQQVAAYREALERLRDCDWVITPHDRMDAVRDMARQALAGDAK